MNKEDLTEQLNQVNQKILSGIKPNPASIVNTDQIVVAITGFSDDEVSEIIHLVDGWMKTRETARISDLEAEKIQLERDLKNELTR